MSDLIITIVTSAVIASLVGPLVNEALRIQRERPSERLGALKAAVRLEGYALRCAHEVTDHETAVNSGGHAGSFMGAVPEFPEIEVSASLLKPRRARVANELAFFPIEVRQADQAAAFWYDVVGDIDATRNAAVKHTACVGLRAIDLAEDLRQAFRLPPQELKFGETNIREILERLV